MPEPRKIGRPFKYTSVEALERDIQDYFTQCDNTIIIKQHAHSKGITEVKTPTPYTMAGLSRALGIARETLNNYQTMTHEDVNGQITEIAKALSDAIMRARDRIQEQNITHGILGMHDSRIAALNLTSNYAYSNKSEIEHKGKLALEDALRDLED